MNTKTEWQTTATIHDPVRALVWGKIFPGARMPIKSIVPAIENLPGMPGSHVYMLDLQAITDEQHEQLVDSIVGLFELPAEEIRKDIVERGVPILADSCSIESTDERQVLNLVGGSPGFEE
jgi:hypothetical protein